MGLSWDKNGIRLGLNMELCDLHTHSIFSDGTCSPKELLILAKEAGLSAVALTDHNTIAGIDFFLEESKNFDIEAIPGVEISSDYEGTELHILALCLDNEHFNGINDFLKIPIKRKEASNKLLAERLIGKGYKVDYDKLKSRNRGSLNRVHFAIELIKNGYVTSIKEAFDTILSVKYGLYEEPKRYTAQEVIEFINSINAVSVLAHPLLTLSKEELIEFLPKAKEYGLMAIETRYSKYSQEEQSFSTQIAKEFGLLESGGSDFHGENKPDIKMGVGMGDLQVPFQFLLKMKNNM